MPLRFSENSQESTFKFNEKCAGKCLHLLCNLPADDQPIISGLNSFAGILSTLVLAKISSREIFPSGFFLMKELARIPIIYLPIILQTHFSICSGNQWTIFYMITASVVKGLKCLLFIVTQSCRFDDSALFKVKVTMFLVSKRSSTFLITEAATRVVL